VLPFSANVEVGTSFLSVIGIDALAAPGFAEVNIPEMLLVEIAMVLDYSGSMREYNKYVRMTSAAQAFIDALRGSRRHNENRHRSVLRVRLRHLARELCAGCVEGGGEAVRDCLPAQSRLPPFRHGSCSDAE
jgi:hypothetical protein